MRINSSSNKKTSFEKIKETFGRIDKPKEEEKPISEEEHKKKLELLNNEGY